MTQDRGRGCAHAIFADAINGKAADLYATFGFTALTDRPNTGAAPFIGESQ